MILDNQTDKVYLAKGLLSYRRFADSLLKAFRDEGIDFGWLPLTDSPEHIWARDYMPIQLEKDLFLQYTYSPDYLAGYPRYVPNCRGIFDVMGLNCISTDIILDGGNVVRCGDKVIMTDKIFVENPRYGRAALVDELERLLSAELVVIPWDRYEMFGHADGMVRHLGGNRVLLNNYADFDRGLRRRLLDSLAGHFEVFELTYPVAERSPLSWAFLNFFQVKDCIFVPHLPVIESGHACRQIQEAFPGCRVRFVDGAEAVVREGGALNCVTWNILSGR